MDLKLKQLWLKVFVGFHLARYFIPIITKTTEAYFRGWLNYWTFNADFFASILFFQPIVQGLIAWATYYYVYKLENKTALKIVTIFSFLICFLYGYRLYLSGNHDWSGNYYIEVMIRESLIFYISLFYFIMNYRLYKTIKSTQNILPSLVIAWIGFFVFMLLSNTWVFFLGWLIMLLGLLPDSIQNTILKKSKTLLLKIFSKA